MSAQVASVGATQVEVGVGVVTVVEVVAVVVVVGTIVVVGVEDQWNQSLRLL
jgi:hypothetical protein